MANEWNNELASLESCITSLGLDRSLTAKILQKATYESIDEFLSYYVEFREKVLRGEIPVCKELSDEMNRIDGLERLYNSLMNLGGNQSGGD